MGRGLSELQRRVLIFVADHRGEASEIGVSPPERITGARWLGFESPSLWAAIGKPDGGSYGGSSNQSSVSRALARLERRGLIRRVNGRPWPGRRRRRTRLVALTPTGEAMVARLRAEDPALVARVRAAEAASLDANRR